jgi:FAD/FMN-containing dehydrogenase
MRADLLSQPGSGIPGRNHPAQRHRGAASGYGGSPGRAEEVAQAVQWASQRNLAVAVQARGHGAGAPIESDRVLVDTPGFSTVHIDAQARVGSPRSATRCTRVSSIRT